MLNYNGKQFVNVGSNADLSIKDLAITIKNIVGFEGELKFDSSKPDGTPKKLMDSSYLNELGWRFKTTLEEGIHLAYADFLSKQ
jgi:GDP-L-fucose synthase